MAYGGRFLEIYELPVSHGQSGRSTSLPASPWLQSPWYCSLPPVRLRWHRRCLRSGLSGLVFKSDGEKVVSYLLGIKASVEKQRAELEAAKAERQKLEADRQKLEAERQKFEQERRRLETDRQKLEADRQRLELEKLKRSREQSPTQSITEGAHAKPRTKVNRP